MSNPYKCEQPCLALKAAVCAQLTECSGRFLVCLSECFDYESVWKDKGEYYVKKNHFRTNAGHCKKCSLADMTPEKIEAQKSKVLNRILGAISYLNGIKRRKEIQERLKEWVETAE